MRRNCFSLIAVVCVSAFIGCSTPTTSFKSNTLRNREFSPSAYSTTIADLDVANKKVMGRAIGLQGQKEVLEKAAVTDALKDNGDVLVGANFFYEIKGGKMEVIVVGYPADYKNFRPARSSDVAVMNKTTEKTEENDVSNQHQKEIGGK